MMKFKKGSHVGMVLSFVIFVTFLVFLYSALEPTIQKDKDKQFLLEHLKKSIMDESTTTLTKVVVSGDELGFVAGGCLEVDTSGVNVVGTNFIVKDEDGDVVNFCGSLGGGVKMAWAAADKNVFTIYVSEENFKEVPVASMSGCVEGEIALTEEDDFIFESRLKTILGKGVDTLKIDYNIPTGNNIYIRFNDEERELLEDVGAEPNVDANIYSEEVPILYIDGSADIQAGFLVIKVW